MKGDEFLRRGVFVTAGLLLLLCLPASAQESRSADGWRAGAGVASLLDPEIRSGEPGASKPDASKLDALKPDASDPDDSESDPEPDGETEEAREEETESGSREDGQAGDLVMADVSNVLNVRAEPDSEAELAGYLYADCGGTILERRDGWTKLVSGELEGWAKDDYLLFGSEAQEAAESEGRTVARTTTGALRIRKEPSPDAGVYDLLEEGAEYEVLDDSQLEFSEGTAVPDGWVAVDYGGKTGYVSADYVEVEFLVDHGETVSQVEQREEEERRAQEAAAAEKRKAEEQKARAMAAADDVLLAALIQCEAGEEPYEGQVAVGAVVMNRVKSGAYPNTIRDVIFASGQFTPAGSGQLSRTVASGSVKSSCLQAAREAIGGASPVGGATHFRRAGSREGIVIGNHVFW